MAKLRPSKRHNAIKMRASTRKQRRLDREQDGRMSIAALSVLGAATGIFAGVLILTFNAPPLERQDSPERNHAQSLYATQPATMQPSPEIKTVNNEQRGVTAVAPIAYRFEFCGAVRETCVVDGDTFWLNGVKIRIADVDTPEIGSPKCEGERLLGLEAKQRLLALLNEGPFELRPNAEGRDVDGYGRQLRVVVRDGRSLGDRLVEEGLAHRWVGSKQPWC